MTDTFNNLLSLLGFPVKDNKRNISEIEKEKQSKDIRKDILRKLLEIFPNEPYCADGEWSWAGQRIDIVYPELILIHKESGRHISVGLCIHSTRSQSDACESLIRACVENGVHLLLIKDDNNPNTEELIRMIEKAFSNEVRVERQ